MKSTKALEARSELQTYLDEYFSARGRLRILDAGCGSGARIRLPDDSDIIGIDISTESAARNRKIRNVIIGDVQTYPLPAKSFDVILCWELLEHIERPRQALRSFFKALRPGGIIVLAFPNIMSLKGLLTKASPHMVHVWVLRHVFCKKNAGRPGFAPFPTYLRWSIEPRAVERFTRENAMEISFRRLYEGNRVATLKETTALAYSIYRMVVGLLNRLAGRRRDFALTDVLFVIRHR